MTSPRVPPPAITAALRVFRQYKDLAERAVAQVSDQALHQALDEDTNAIAVILQHVAGNLTSRFTEFLTSDGEKPWRDRDGEFVDVHRSRTELMALWEQGWSCLFGALEVLTPADLDKTVFIRGEAHPVWLAVARALAHCAYHVGQIVLIARVLAGDQWETLTIPRGGSAVYNRAVWGRSSDPNDSSLPGDAVPPSPEPCSP